MLVDLKYSYLEEMMNRMNDSNRGRYYYVCDGAGNLIYHPYYNKINRGLFRENTDIVCTSEDGVYKKMRSEDGNKPVSYTHLLYRCADDKGQEAAAGG